MDLKYYLCYPAKCRESNSAQYYDCQATGSFLLPKYAGIESMLTGKANWTLLFKINQLCP